MYPSVESKSSQQVTWEQRLLRNSGKQKPGLKPEFQELKFTLHRKLVDKINLEALATIDNQRVRSEIDSTAAASRGVSSSFCGTIEASRMWHLRFGFANAPSKCFRCNRQFE